MIAYKSNYKSSNLHERLISKKLQLAIVLWQKKVQWTFVFVHFLWPLPIYQDVVMLKPRSFERIVSPGNENKSYLFLFYICSVVHPRMADHIRRVLTGDVTDLPRKESNIVRIFTSSTFTGNYLSTKENDSENCFARNWKVISWGRAVIHFNLIYSKSSDNIEF